VLTQLGLSKQGKKQVRYRFIAFVATGNMLLGAIMVVLCEK
jgi:hypothetical protein